MLCTSARHVLGISSSMMSMIVHYVTPPCALQANSQIAALNNSSNFQRDP